MKRRYAVVEQDPLDGIEGTTGSSKKRRSLGPLSTNGEHPNYSVRCDSINMLSREHASRCDASWSQHCAYTLASLRCVLYQLGTSN